MNWTSLLFSSGANLIVPFTLYLLSKRYHTSAVLDSHHRRRHSSLSKISFITLMILVPLIFQNTTNSNCARSKGLSHHTSPFHLIIRGFLKPSPSNHQPPKPTPEVLHQTSKMRLLESSRTISFVSSNPRRSTVTMAKL
jgi:hypothetical protein